VNAVSQVIGFLVGVGAGVGIAVTVTVTVGVETATAGLVGAGPPAHPAKPNATTAEIVIPVRGAHVLMVTTYLSLLKQSSRVPTMSTVITPRVEEETRPQLAVAVKP
jgi:hypothetical protein